MKVLTAKRVPGALQYRPNYPHSGRLYAIGGMGESDGAVFPVPVTAQQGIGLGTYFVFGIAVGVTTHFLIKFLDRR